MRRSLSLTLLSLLLAVSAAGAAWAYNEEEPFEQTAAIAATGRLSVANTNGHIYVETWNRDEVSISALKKVRSRDSGEALDLLREIEIEVTESGGDVTVDTRLPRRRGWFGGGVSVSVEYTIKVPATVSLRLKSTNGKIEVEGAGGDVDLTTTNGGIWAKDLGGRLEAETTNGKIEAYEIAGPVDAETTNGSIYAEVTAATLADDMTLTTTNGGVELRLAPSLAARIDARTSNGSVRSDLPVSVYGSQKRNALSGDVNGGGSTIRIRSSNGSIRIREQ